MTEAIFVSENEYSIAIWDYYAIHRFIVYEKWWKKCDQNNGFDSDYAIQWPFLCIWYKLNTAHLA